MNVRWHAPDGNGDDAFRAEASHWIVRQDRTLTAEEACELRGWLAADPRHAAALERAERMWRISRAIGATSRKFSEAAPAHGGVRSWWGAAALAAAAAIAFGALWLPRRETAPQRVPKATVALAAEALPRTRTLADGTIVILRGDAEIEISFSEAERLVRLVRGESFFAVAPNSRRPFVVEVGGTRVRAVGTAFAVRFTPEAVAVLVTEGTVQVSPSTPAESRAPSRPAFEVTKVTAGYRAVVPRRSAAHRVTVSAVPRADVERELGWNEPILELAGATLREIVGRLSRAAGQAIEVAPELASLRLGGQLPATDVEGFVRAMEEIYQVKTEHRPDGSILLRKAP